MQLGPRLRKVAGFVPQGTVLADIGSDHGHLLAWLLQEGRIERAIAGELNPQPAARTLQTVNEAGLSALVSVRIGSGLTVLKPGEADTVVIAGLGGATIAEILSQAPDVFSTLKRCVLQPNGAGAAVRKRLTSNGWRIVAEALVEENELIYEIIVAEPSLIPSQTCHQVLLESVPALSWLEAELGPLLIKERPPLFLRWVQTAIARRERIVDELSNAKDPDAAMKRQRLQDELEELGQFL